jgi:hypothetical protein
MEYPEGPDAVSLGEEPLGTNPRRSSTKVQGETQMILQESWGIE